MPYCRNCGNNVNSEDKYCPECGTALTKTKKSVNDSNLENSESTYSTIEKTIIRDNPVYGLIKLDDLPNDFELDNRYIIKFKIGQGGFGAVYKAYDKKIDVDKAIKIIPSTVCNDIEALLNLRTETKAMVSLNHPFIIRVFDFHETGEIKYIDMEYIEGSDLSVIKNEAPEKKLTETHVLKYLKQIAEAMDHAHSKNIIHRDLKPQNIIVSQEGNIKVLDFGIAQTLNASMSRLVNVSSSGTLVYMSPEQIRGSHIGKETDIYSFGAICYELLSGKPPFWQGAIEYQILNEKPSRIAGVSNSTMNLILRCLEKDYRNRYKSFDEILNKEKITIPSSKPVNKKPKSLNITFLNNMRKRFSFQKVLFFKIAIVFSILIIVLSAAFIFISKMKKDYSTDLTSTSFIMSRDIEPESNTTIHDSNSILEYNDNKEQKVVPVSENKNIDTVGSKNEKTFDSLQKNIETTVITKGDKSDITDTPVAVPKPSEMVKIKGGTFLMGAEDGEDDEKPVHLVTVRSFYLDKTEVTQTQFKSVMGKNPSDENSQCMECPVTNVNYYNAKQYCEKISRRLPTEAEWEYAVRAGSKSNYFWGFKFNEDYLWYSQNANGKAHPVGLKKTNAFGLHDMLGNVWEWCSDGYSAYRDESQIDPENAKTSDMGLMRGGSYKNSPNEISVSNRYQFKFANYQNNTGFRCACSK